MVQCSPAGAEAEVDHMRVNGALQRPPAGGDEEVGAGGTGHGAEVVVPALCGLEDEPGISLSTSSTTAPCPQHQHRHYTTNLSNSNSYRDA